MMSKVNMKTSRFASASITLSVIGIICFLIAISILISPLNMERYYTIGGVLFKLSLVLFPASFVLGIVGFFRKDSKVGVYAISSVIIGGLFTLLMLLFFFTLRIRLYTNTYTSKYNLKLFGGSLIEYSKDNNGCLPPAQKWCDLLVQHQPDLPKYAFTNRRKKPGNTSHFAFNENLDGLRLADVPSDVVLLFEARGDWNLAGGPQLLETRRKYGRIYVLFVDQTIGAYYFSEEGVINYAEKGPDKYTYKPLRWKP